MPVFHGYQWCHGGDEDDFMTRSEFRDRLDQVTADPDVNTHAASIADLRKDYPHTVEVLPSDRPLPSYNCVMHALGLIGLTQAGVSPGHAAPVQFVQYLIDNGHLTSCKARPGVMVTWSTSGKLAHIGKLTKDPSRAESKLGLGPLLSHRLDEVPSRYGKLSGYYAPIPPEEARRQLDAYVDGIASR
jgi:hypothetical protein